MIQMMICRFVLVFSLAGFIFLLPTLGYALPQNGQVVGGTATIDTTIPQQITINQTTDRAAMNWNQFNIAAGELVRFVQPGLESVALNRVTGIDPSHIFGSLTANGRVFLINPNGILFGAGSVIDVAGLLATTLKISDPDFMNGGLDTFLKDGASYVVNQGNITINSNSGFVFLVGSGVKNEGAILANLGKVVLGAAESLTLDFTGTGLVNYTLGGDVLAVINGPNGLPLTSAIDHSGSITADGGEVILSAMASSAVFSSLIKQNGIVQASQVSSVGGVVRLISSDSIGIGGGIAAGAAGSIKAGTIDLSAATGSIGAASAPLKIETASLTLPVGQSFFVQNASDLSTLNLTTSQMGGDNNSYSLTAPALTFSLTDAGTNYQLTTVTDTTGLNFNFTGDETIAVGTIGVGSGASVVLDSRAGSILDDGVDATRITAGALTLSSGAYTGSIGTETSGMDTTVGSITAVAGNGGVFIRETDALILSGVTTNNGKVNIATESGDLTVNGNVSAGLAPITLTAVGLAGGLDRTLTNNARIQGGELTVVADRMVLENGTIRCEECRVTLAPYTPNRPVFLGPTTNNADGLELSDSELDTITAGVLQIGNRLAGPILINAPIDTKDVNTMTLMTGGAITQRAPLVEANLRIEAAGPVELANAGNDVDVLSANAPVVGSHFSFVDQGDLTVGIVDTVTGIRVSGNVVIDAGEAGTGELTQNVGTAISSDGGDISLAAPGDVKIALLDARARAGVGAVSVISDGNAILDNDMGTVDGSIGKKDIDIYGSRLTLRAPTIGGLDPESQIDYVEIRNARALFGDVPAFLSDKISHPEAVLLGQRVRYPPPPAYVESKITVKQPEHVVAVSPKEDTAYIFEQKRLIEEKMNLFNQENLKIAAENAKIAEEMKAFEVKTRLLNAENDRIKDENPDLEEKKMEDEDIFRHIFFDLDRWNIRQDAALILQEQAKWLNEHPALVIEIGGYTDERGTGSYNIALGEKRSQSAKHYFQDLGIDSSRISVKTYGKKEANCGQGGEPCHQTNRKAKTFVRFKNR